MVDVSIIIVNYNTFALTCDCIQTVITHTRDILYEIIVVDNASGECDPALIKEKYPVVKLIKNTENLGFAKGNNAGIREANGQYILLLNSDTRLLENSIRHTHNRYKQLKKPAFVGIRTLYPDGSLQYTCERLPTLKNLLARIFLVTRIFNLTRKYSKLDQDFEPEALWGSYLFFDKKLLSHFRHQQLNELFFMYHEDMLWCWEARKAGLHNYFIADTSFIHVFKGSQLNAAIKLKMNKHFADNYLTLEKKINGPWYPLYALAKKLISWKQRLKSES